MAKYNWLDGSLMGDFSGRLPCNAFGRVGGLVGGVLLRHGDKYPRQGPVRRKVADQGPRGSFTGM